MTIDVDVDALAARPSNGHVTLAGLVGHLVYLVMSRDWTAATAGKELLEVADGDVALLGRARVQVLKTTSPRSQVSRRALLTLAHAQAAAASSQTPQ